MIKVKFKIDPEDQFRHSQYDFSDYSEIYVTFDVDGEPYIAFVNKQPVVYNKIVMVDDRGRIQDTLDEYEGKK